MHNCSRPSKEKKVDKIPLFKIVIGSLDGRDGISFVHPPPRLAPCGFYLSTSVRSVLDRGELGEDKCDVHPVVEGAKPKTVSFRVSGHRYLGRTM